MQQPTSGISQPSVNTMQLVTRSRSPTSKPLEDLIAFALGCAAIDVLRPDALANEFVAQMDRMLDIYGEYDGFLPHSVLEPVPDDIADQLRLIHTLGELALLHVVTSAGMHAL